jgi:hypothetical protein
MLKDTPEGDFEVFESTPEGTDYVRGASLTLRYWLEQSNICRQAGAPFEPPYADQKVATSVGVMEGDVPVWGVRYSAPPHMSGWYLTTDRYSGNIEDLKVGHLHHLTALRPDLVRFLALPHGYRFELTGQGERAYFDAQVLKEK